MGHPKTLASTATSGIGATGHSPVWFDADTNELFWEINQRTAARRVLSLGNGGTLPIASLTTLGAIRASGTLNVAADGTATVPLATAYDPGIVRLADGAAINAGTPGRVVDAAQLMAAIAGLGGGGGGAPLQPATPTVLGGIKIGAGLSAAADGLCGLDYRNLPPIP